MNRVPRGLTTVFAIACAILAGGASALGAQSFADPAGDDNAAPDLTSVALSEAAGVLELSVAVENYDQLPPDSWIEAGFDLDENESTGVQGIDKIVRYFWSGAIQVSPVAPTTGMSGSFTAGVATISLPMSALDDGSFRLVVVGSRGQRRHAGAPPQYFSTDRAPNSGHATYGGAPLAVADPVYDNEAVPDVTAVEVSDSPDGWIGIAITTRNLSKIPGPPRVWIAFDRGAETAVDGTLVRGLVDAQLQLVEDRVGLSRMDLRTHEWSTDRGARARARVAGDVLTFEIHRSELDFTPAFGFFLVTTTGAARVGGTGFDIAPDSEIGQPITAPFWRYALTNKPPMRLVRSALVARAGRPHPGRRFVVQHGVWRSDRPNQPVTSAKVTCSASLGSVPVPAQGRFVGVARCSMAIPRRTSGKRLRGSITVRAAGRSLTSKFAYVVGD